MKNRCNFTQKNKKCLKLILKANNKNGKKEK